ncbi:MAG: hypothetical protein Q4G03_10985 [Planctomycetia bacterium]|nr:hypothetical protein [Planctomycetia bacterium]
MKRSSTNATLSANSRDRSAPLSRFLQLDEQDSLDHTEAQWVFIANDADDQTVVETAPDLSALKRIKDFLNATENANAPTVHEEPFLGAQNARVDYPYYDGEHEESRANFTPFEPTRQSDDHDSQEDYALELKADEIPVLTVASPNFTEQEPPFHSYEIIDVDPAMNDQDRDPSDVAEEESVKRQESAAFTTVPETIVLPEAEAPLEVVATRAPMTHDSQFETPRPNEPHKRNAAKLPIFTRFLSILAQNENEESHDLGTLHDSNDDCDANASRLVDVSCQNDTIQPCDQESSVTLALGPSYSPDTPGCSLVAAFCDQDAELNSTYTAIASALD